MNYNQQVSVDLVNMVYTAIAYLALAGAAWLFLRLIQACFWLPGHMKRQNDVQRMLQEKVDSYERYIEECEAREAREASGEGAEETDGRTLEEKRKERRECLDMLKRELQRIKDGGDPYDFNHLLDEEEKKLLEEIDQDEELDDPEKQPLASADEESEAAVGEESEAAAGEDPEPKKEK